MHMQRREFLAASALASGVTMAASTASAAAAPENEYYELRRYQLLYGPKQERFHDFLSKVAIPAMNRLGVGPVGVFYIVYGVSSSHLYVLLPHPNLGSVATLNRRLAADPEYRKAGEAVIAGPTG